MASSRGAPVQRFKKSSNICSCAAWITVYSCLKNMKEKIKEPQPSPKSSNGHQIASRFMPANPALNLEGSKLPVNLAATAVATSSKSVVDRWILPMRLSSHSSLLTLGKTGESRDWKIENMFFSLMVFVFAFVCLSFCWFRPRNGEHT